MDSELQQRHDALDFMAEFDAVEPVEWRPYTHELLPYPLIVLDDVPTDAGDVGFDAQGRPVKALIGSERFVWLWDEDGCLELAWRFMTMVARITHKRIERYDMLGRTSVVKLTWRNGVAVRADESLRWEGGGKDVVRNASYDANGRLVRIAVGAKIVWEATPEVVWPGVEAARELVEPLAASLDAALRAAASASGIEAPFFLLVSGREWPGEAWLASARWRDHVRSIAYEDGAAVEDIYRGRDRGLVADLELELDDAALAACRVLACGHPEASKVGFELRQRLADALNARPLDDAADPFLAAVGGNAFERVELERAYVCTGDADVHRFHAAMTSLAEHGPAQRALTDRAALEQLFVEAGVSAHAHRLAYEVAEVGLLLEPGDGRSRLGGPGLVPPGEPWPGELTFLAALDLSEIEVLPGAGWLLFFLGEEDGEGELDARVLYTDAPVAADGPTLTGGWPLAFRALLTLPEDFEAGERLGLDDAESEAYDEVRHRLRAELPTVRHWVGGLVAGIQTFPPEPDTVLLLHLDWDDELGFAYGDGGTVQFRSPADAGWSDFSVSGESC